MRPHFEEGEFYFHLGPDSLPSGSEDPYYWHSEGVIDGAETIAVYYCSRAGRALSQNRQLPAENKPFDLYMSPSAGPIPLTLWSEAPWPEDAVARMDCYFKVERWSRTQPLEGGVAAQMIMDLAPFFASHAIAPEASASPLPDGYDWIVFTDGQPHTGAHIGYFEVAEHPDIFRIWLTSFLRAGLS
ncbi:hypothetical protein [Pseudooctadecabacter sp.]|uniref:hypothetical protein n=1 Tax=Pseudooctadecabacter sp. TaxID=1966338 RepID=UPI0035C7D946